MSAGCDGEAVGRLPVGFRGRAESRKPVRWLALFEDPFGQGFSRTVGWNRLRDVYFAGRGCAESLGRGCWGKTGGADDVERADGPGASGRKKREAGGRC